MRHTVVEMFKTQVTPKMAECASVALVGGSPGDPELSELPRSAVVTHLGIERTSSDSNFVYLDLNRGSSEFLGRYDLVLCSQVLEHVWNVSGALRELTTLVAPGGLLWIGVPASNFPHGSPEYYYAGFTPDSISRQLRTYGMEALDSGLLGSQRCYVWTHVFRHWPTRDELARPVSSSLARAFNTPAPMWKRLARGISSMRSLLLLFFSERTRTDVTYATETWVLARKPIEFEESS